jgi:hypothetical protein
MDLVITLILGYFLALYGRALYLASCWAGPVTDPGPGAREGERGEHHSDSDSDRDRDRDNDHGNDSSKQLHASIHEGETTASPSTDCTALCQCTGLWHDDHCSMQFNK